MKHVTLLLVLFYLLAACGDAMTGLTAMPSPTPTPALEGIQVWVTLGDRSKLLSHEPPLRFTPGRPLEGTTIQIDASILYQQFEGAGAAMTESSAWLIMDVLDERTREELMRNLFTREGSGIGLSYLRLPMGASDFALDDYTYNDLPLGQTDPTLRFFNIERDRKYVIPALKMALALNPDLRLMGSPWSAPAWMKRGERLHGSSLRPEFFQAFADYHVRFIQAYAAEGITIDAITPQNEPLHASESYPTMYMSAQEQQKFVRDHLGPALRAANLKTKILILDHNWDLADYALEVLSDPAAAAYVDGVAFHCYGGDVSAQSRIHAAFPEKGIWFTECSGGEWATDFSANLKWNLENLVIGNFRHWGKSLLLWNLALDENHGPQNGGCPNCRGVVTIHRRTRQITYNEEYYVLGHVTKFVDPGAYRIQSTPRGNGVPDHVAFLNPDGSLVLIVQTDSKITFHVTWNGRFFTYSMPASGVVTFKWQANVQPIATVTVVAAATPTPRPTPPAAQAPSAGLLLDFEDRPTIFAAQNAQAEFGEIAYSGQRSLKSSSTDGNWHIVGVRLNRPLDLTGFQKLCFWVYDTTLGDTGKANNTVGLRLTDAFGRKQEIWSDHAVAGPNPRTWRNTWVQMCFWLSAYREVDLQTITSLEFETYWPGQVYFDDVSLEKSLP
ncbi:MAG: hypothetical protein NZL98_01950 [Anaerolineales bacterium]|nr:hypothetical protein [Anaerolineales bacterium]MDW8227148.1 glycoside hydrolase family 30 beta sandwich domain-containing protein [Anaerolineales bacterium]